ncbi:MAG TPA: hypothetical protein VGY48_10990 [Vicinamibacterales bacterium]|jgi:hypothetical protein|nr:hypothetical protein [Vicinamibacterales bacterium]
MPRRPFAVVLPCLGLAACLAPRLIAHEVRVDLVVEIFIAPQGHEVRDLPRLHVLARVPAELLSDIGFPPDNIEAASVAALLPLAASDVASRLDVLEDERPLPPAAATATVAPDRKGLDIEIAYPASASNARFSARLNAFRHSTKKVRTVAHYRGPSGFTQVVRVGGDARRVVFDPGWTQTLQQFAIEGLQQLAGPLALWFLVGLAAPPRRTRTTIVALVALIAGQSAGLAGARWGLAPGGDLFGPLADTVAAAALVGIGLQAITHGRTRWAWSIALVYGLASGLRAGEALQGSLDLAGRHTVVASAAFGLALAVGQGWVALLVRSVAQAVSRWTAHDRVVAVVAAVPVVHAGVHELVVGRQALQVVEWPRLDALHLVLISCWAMALVLTGLVMAQVARRVDPPGDVLSDSGSHAG